MEAAPEVYCGPSASVRTPWSRCKTRTPSAAAPGQTSRPQALGESQAHGALASEAEALRERATAEGARADRAQQALDRAQATFDDARVRLDGAREELRTTAERAVEAEARARGFRANSPPSARTRARSRASGSRREPGRARRGSVPSAGASRPRTRRMNPERAAP
jgi:hypothetical protein